MDIHLLKTELQELVRECQVWQLIAKGEAQIYLSHVVKKLSSIQEQLDEKNQSKNLSPKEKEILTHVSNGFTNREIASALSVSEKTIEYHMKSIFQKTHTSKRTEAVTFALKSGLI